MSGAIAITLGDPAGIGPEIIAKAFRDAPDATRGAFVAGDVATLRRASQALAGPGQPAWPVAQIETVAEVGTLPPGCIPVLQVIAPPANIVLGQISAEAGRAAGDCVVWAARAALRGEITRRPWPRPASHTPAIPSCCRPKPRRTWAAAWPRCRCA
jgi:4-hydroxythreonine-4-phosphate dehydrogenase